MIGEKLTAEQRDGLFLISGQTHPELAASIAGHMGIELAEVELTWHPDGSPYVRIEDDVREGHVIALQSHANAEGRSISDSFNQHLEIIDAARHSKAALRTAVAPSMIGARQDRQAKRGESVSIAKNLHLLEAVGATKFVTVDIHTIQSLSIFRGEQDYEHFTAYPLLIDALKAQIKQGSNPEEYIMVSPDEGRSKLAMRLAEQLGIGVLHLDKSRDGNDSQKILRTKPVVASAVEGRRCIMVDDIIDTAGTIVSGAEQLKQAGAQAIYAAAVHAPFSDPAIERLQQSPIEKILVTDTLPVDKAKKELGERLQVESVAEMMADGLAAIVAGRSVSSVFAGENYI